jgi:hypothetical protein
MTLKLHIAFLKEHLVPWYKKKSLAFPKNMVLMLDNAPSPVAHQILGQCFCQTQKNRAMASLRSIFKSY